LRWVKLRGLDSDATICDPSRCPSTGESGTGDGQRLWLAFAQFSWSGVDEFGGHSFLANRAGSLGTYISDDGAGSYRLTVRPYAGTHWYVEVDALK
jgi:hypothetical protein